MIATRVHTRATGPARRGAVALLAAFAALLAAAAPAAAQANRDVTIGLYLEEAGSQPNCNKIKLLDCDDSSIQVTGELNTAYYAFLCVFNGDASEGISGLQCGLRFNDARNVGVEIESWRSCADLEYPQSGWASRSGVGNRILWSNNVHCQQEEPGGIGQGVTAVGGYFYLSAYSPDQLEVVPWKGTGYGEGLRVTNCANAETELEDAAGGSLGFSDDGSVKGSLPCNTRIQEETTWGGVKNLYNNRR